MLSPTPTPLPIEIIDRGVNWTALAAIGQILAAVFAVLAIALALSMAKRDRKAADDRGDADRAAADRRAEGDRSAAAALQAVELAEERRVDRLRWEIDLLLQLSEAHMKSGQNIQGAVTGAYGVLAALPADVVPYTRRNYLGSAGATDAATAAAERLMRGRTGVSPQGLAEIEIREAIQERAAQF